MCADAYEDKSKSNLERQREENVKRTQAKGSEKRKAWQGHPAKGDAGRAGGVPHRPSAAP